MKKNNEDERTSDAPGKSRWETLPPAKRHPLLVEASKRLVGCHKEGSFPLYGMRFKLRTLDYLADVWATNFVHQTPPDTSFITAKDIMLAAKTIRAPTIAAAIVGICFTEEETVDSPMYPIEDLFTVPDDLPLPLKNAIAADEHTRLDWLRTEVLRWLGEKKDSHPLLLQKLYDHYLTLDSQRKEALEALSPLSKRTPTGESSDTSSPKQGGSSQTPPSEI